MPNKNCILRKQVIRAKHKIKASAFGPQQRKGDVATVTLALASNMMEVSLALSTCNQSVKLVHV